MSGSSSVSKCCSPMYKTKVLCQIINKIEQYSLQSQGDYVLNALRMDKCTILCTCTPWYVNENTFKAVCALKFHDSS